MLRLARPAILAWICRMLRSVDDQSTEAGGMNSSRALWTDPKVAYEFKPGRAKR
jgi:hypothetical protein